MKRANPTRWTVGLRAALGIVGVGLVLATAGCGSSGSGAPPSTVSGPTRERPSSTATVAVRSPKNGQVVGSSTVPLRVSLTGGELVPAASTNLRPDEGHLHVLLDDQLVSMTSGLRENIPDVQAGSHVLRVEFVASDHAPFDPRVIDDVTFEVEA
jgi:hypothetical protein